MTTELTSVELRSTVYERQNYDTFNSTFSVSSVYTDTDTDTDTLLKITQQTCMNTIKIIQCNDYDTRKGYNVKKHQLTNECLKALRLHCGSV